jgi:hypothetical protein
MNYGVGGIAKPRSVFGDRIQDGLDLSWRAGNDAQNLARRCLLL